MPSAILTRLLTGIILIGAMCSLVAAQVPQEAALVEALPPDQAAELTLANRPIIVLRARILTHRPAQRVATAREVLDKLVEDNIVGPVVTGRAGALRYLGVADRPVLEIVPDDLDPASALTIDDLANSAAAALRVALAEAAELRNPGRVTEAVIRVAIATLLLLAALYVLRRVHRWARGTLTGWTSRHVGQTLDRLAVGEQVTLFVRLLRGIVALIAVAVALLAVNWWLGYSLGQFPYTRPLGDTLSARLVARLSALGFDLLQALPGLLVVTIVVLATRMLIRLTSAFFTQVERGRTDVRWAHPETAAATRRMVAIALWLLAIVMSYPYLPGTESDAFKGVSVFVGLVISLGSSGLVNQLMSGLSLTYSRALKIGDIVRIGDSSGVVTSMGLFSVKLRGLHGDEITVPNAVVVGQSTGNYSRLAPDGASYISTTVTIGYDAPWRQVQALLLLGAERTAGISTNPAPRVLQEALEDFYVRYRLTVCTESGVDRLATRTQLFANIQDAFNEFGVQIMSPNYEADPESPKVVPRERWYARPAAPQRAPDTPKP